MSVIVKSAAKATKEYRYKTEEGLSKIVIQPGRNILTEEKYEILKNHGGFKLDLNKDKVTVNTEGTVAKQAKAEPDMAYIDTLLGVEDGKDILKEYALAWDITLNKKNTIENMIESFKAQYKKG